jgi:two-component system CheB/CheR fusion protein
MELQTTKENLQATIEELETSNEELQATNEELLSSNEELQSTNEELQSVNEELITVNSEYQKKIEELSQLNDDMNNLLSAGDVGTIFLAEDLTIRKFTTAAADHFNIIKSDTGRKISDLSHHLNYESFMEDIQEVKQSDKPRQVEITSRKDRWLLVKILPYRGSRPSPEGVVISIIDITDRKEAELALIRQHELLMRVLEASPSGIVMLDARARIVFANPRAADILGVGEEDMNRTEYGGPDLPIADEENSMTPAKLLDEMGKGTDITDVTQRITRRDGSEITVRVQGSPIYDEAHEVEGAVLNLTEV